MLEYRWPQIMAVYKLIPAVPAGKSRQAEWPSARRTYIRKNNKDLIERLLPLTASTHINRKHDFYLRLAIESHPFYRRRRLSLSLSRRATCDRCRWRVYGETAEKIGDKNQRTLQITR